VQAVQSRADAGDVVGAGGGSGEGGGDGGARGAPPLLDVLLGPGGVRVEGVEGGGGVAATGALEVEEGGADALGADVEAEEEG